MKKEVVCNHAYDYPSCAACNCAEPHYYCVGGDRDCHQEGDCSPDGSDNRIRVQCVRATKKTVKANPYITCPCCNGVGKIKKER